MPTPDSIIICGVVRDCERRLPRALKILDKVRGLFKLADVFLYENNSKDATPAILEEYAARGTGATVLSETTDESVYPDNPYEGGKYRPTTISDARNRCLWMALINRQETQYLAMMDMDFVVDPDYDGILSCFERDDWDAVFANGIDPTGAYWDWFAFRDANFPYGPEKLGRAWWSVKRHVHFNGNEWHRVLSAFGGFGIYRMDAIRGCQYAAPVIESCEHAGLHSCMGAHGYDRLFINPKMIWRYSGD